MPSLWQEASADTDEVPTVTVASGVGFSPQAERRRRPADTAPRAATLRRALPEKSGAVMSRRLSGRWAAPPHGVPVACGAARFGSAGCGAVAGGAAPGPPRLKRRRGFIGPWG
ncbi:hypothetical protein Snoj_65470 [Streptomyces nojiriensis]|uniref:Uncharacterized protein n=1 Tax=Streptomyces nojiriensis TaxID=66374 RepID=A0ABQ3SWV8_9ACTN|nr:hypothetical protein GCM10010205_15090 [Streptomyces nojiriensis]GHI72629.1 hypothetical protein Snoj_65470 [Streptomyces nojiriensis]